MQRIEVTAIIIVTIKHGKTELTQRDHLSHGKNRTHSERPFVTMCDAQYLTSKKQKKISNYNLS